MNENVWTFCFDYLALVLHCRAHHSTCSEIPCVLSHASLRAPTRMKGNFSETLCIKIFNETFNNLLQLISCALLSFVDLVGDHRHSLKTRHDRSRLYGGQMRSLFELPTRPLNFAHTKKTLLTCMGALKSPCPSARSSNHRFPRFS